jgi:hypothetical protein
MTNSISEYTAISIISGYGNSHSSSSNEPTECTSSLGTTFLTPPAAVVPPATPPLAPSPPDHALNPPPLPTILVPTVVFAGVQFDGGRPMPNQYPAGGCGCAWMVQMMMNESEASTVGWRKSWSRFANCCHPQFAVLIAKQ